MPNNISRPKLFILFVFALLAAIQSNAQVTINGSTCVIAGNTYVYTYSGPNSGSTTMTWCVTNGTIVQAYGSNVTVSGGCPSGKALGSIAVTWGGSGTGTVRLSSSSGNAPLLTTSIKNPLNGGNISQTSPTIPYNTATTININCTVATGSCNTSYAYQWQKSADGTSWTDLSGLTSQNASFSQTLLSQTYYRRKVTDGGGTIAYSNTYSVPVAAPFSYTQIQPLSSDIYTGTTPPTISGPAASGGNCGGSYTYQWQFSTDGGNTFNNVTNGTGGTTISYTPAPLTVSTIFRRQDNCGSQYSNSNNAGVTVHAHLAAATITPAGPLTITYNTSPGLFTSGNATGGICSDYPTRQWQQSTDGVNFSDVGTAGYSNYDPGNLTTKTYIRCKYVCGETVMSSIVTINVNPPLFPGSIFPSSINIAINTSPGQLVANTASGGNCGSFAYQWQQSPDGLATSFTDITGATAAYYTPPVMSTTAWFRRKVSCGIDISYTNACNVIIGTTAQLFNYRQVRDIAVAGILTEADAAQLTDPASVKQTTQYYDGLGRVIQTVGRQSSPTAKDMVVANVYDEFGRETAKYLPYTSAQNDGRYKPYPLQEQIAFNAVQFPGEQFYYERTDFESSPLLLKQAGYAPGNDWTGSNRGSQFNYWSNTAADAVRIWTIAEPTGDFDLGSITSSSFYNPGTLNKSVSTDEHGNQSIEFKDFQGKTLFKKTQLMAAKDNGAGGSMNGWISTYYIYDDYNNLRYVIQPQGVVAIPETGTWTADVTFMGKWIFVYRYDQRNRMVLKKVPGAAPSRMLYDLWDRLAATQDADMNATNTWLFTKYDVYNRPVVTGTMVDTRSQSAIQTDINAAGRYETVNTAAAEGYTLTGSFPSAGTLTIYTITHYDDYANLPSWSSAYGFVSEYTATDKNASVKGQVVATQTRILGTTNFLRTVLYYDDKYRLIQSTADNVVGTKDRITNLLSFDGKTTAGYQSHVSNVYTVPLVTARTFTYDNSNRLLKTTHQLTGSSDAITLSHNTYNEPGQLLTKKLHESDLNAGYLQHLDYSYNIRGWLTGINQPFSDATGYDPTDLFNFQLHYNTTHLQNAVPQYNGNISEQLWKGGYDEYLRGYEYVYDKANRLLTADYACKALNASNTPVWDFSRKYSENVATFDVNGNINSGTGYDLNGNILYLERFHGGMQVDALSYKNYNGNKLGRIDESASGTSPVGFQDQNNAADDYLYDDNGNLTFDLNKGITAIAYNYLNLPALITMGSKGTIAYLYDAAGNKLQKTVTDQGVSPNKITITKYAGAFVYTNSYLSGATPPVETLEFIAHEEGRIRPAKIDAAQPLTAANTRYIYDYFMKDHLGNTRMVLTTEQQTDLYAATQEPANATKENQLFSNLSSTTIAKPAGFDSDGSNTNVSHVNGSAANTRVGPSIILKVMAGDVISVSTQAWYTGGTQGVPTGLGPIKDQLLTLLTNGIAANNGTQHGAIPLSTISDGSSSVLDDFLSNTQSYNTSQPKAFLNWMIVDEEFKKVTSSFHMGAVQVPLVSGSMQKQPLVGPADMTVRRNGWLYVYVSNESGQEVYFDDLIINHQRGPVVEMNNYYPFGLEIPGLHSQAVAFGGSNDNRIKYNGKELQSSEFNDGSGLTWEDYGARMYNPQIGRFMIPDRFADKYHPLSPYQYGANNPISIIDVNGDSIWIVIKTNITDANGNQSVQEDKYHYGQDKNGTYGFLDGSGSAYSGSEAFVGDVTTAIDKIRTGGDVGKTLVNDLMTSANSTEIVNRSSNEAGDKGDYIAWNPKGTSSAPDTKGSTTRPSFIGLAHEMAHVRDTWNGTKNKNTWQTVTDANGNTITIPNAELYSTHIENQIRSENKLPLRAYYGVDASGSGDPSTRLIRAGTQQSLYYNPNGTTNYKPLGRKQPAFTY